MKWTWDVELDEETMGLLSCFYLRVAKRNLAGSFNCGLVTLDTKAGF